MDLRGWRHLVDRWHFCHILRSLEFGAVSVVHVFIDGVDT